MSNNVDASIVVSVVVECLDFNNLNDPIILVRPIVKITEKYVIAPQTKIRISGKLVLFLETHLYHD